MVMTALTNQSHLTFMSLLRQQSINKGGKGPECSNYTCCTVGYLFLPIVGVSNLSHPCYLPVFTFHFQLTQIRGKERFRFSVILPTFPGMTATCA